MARRFFGSAVFYREALAGFFHAFLHFQECQYRNAGCGRATTVEGHIHEFKVAGTREQLERFGSDNEKSHEQEAGQKVGRPSICPSELKNIGKGKRKEKEKMHDFVDADKSVYLGNG